MLIMMGTQRFLDAFSVCGSEGSGRRLLRSEMQNEVTSGYSGLSLHFFGHFVFLLPCNTARSVEQRC